jgi:hypothetical protein
VGDAPNSHRDLERVSARRASPSLLAAQTRSASSSPRSAPAEPALRVGDRGAEHLDDLVLRQRLEPEQRRALISAEFTLNSGFSVVAPISVISPRSTSPAARPAGSW